jgi:hypothetical protein
MAEMELDVCWGEQPFVFGEDAWPSPLMRLCPWPEDLEARGLMEGTPNVSVPDELLARWRKAESEFIACQLEFQRLAREHGMLQ